jgi:hypothetical protein
VPVERFEFDSELWLWKADAAWHFLTVPADISDEIAERTREQPRGFGSVKARVRIGATTWSTSVFPDTERGAYVLPVKREVRDAEGLAAGSRAHVLLELVEI